MIFGIALSLINLSLALGTVALGMRVYPHAEWYEIVLVGPLFAGAFLFYFNLFLTTARVVLEDWRDRD
jgi:hypothetical protein